MTYVKHDQFIGRSLATYGEWAQLEVDAILRYVVPGDFVIDVGANIGFHSLSFARKVGKSGMVWAFEPDPVNGLLLRHNIIRAGLDDVVVPFDLALSDALGICPFRTHRITAPGNFGHTGIDGREGDYPRVSMPLDALPLDRGPTLIKIDIEGHELSALGGMTEVIERYRPVLSIEADTPEEIEANGAFAASLGYDVYSLVVNAYNPHNFAENANDIWKGHGRCANLLCVVPGKHAAPDDLELLRRADVERRAISQMGKSVGAAYSALSVGSEASAEVSIHSALGTSQAEIKRFVSSFLKTTYGKLDPVSDSALVNGALDFLAANGSSAEGLALQRLIVAGVESFADALGSRNRATELAEVRAAHDRLLDETGALTDTIDQLTKELEALQEQHRLALEDMSSRLGAATSAEVRIASELARQGEMARRELAAALTKGAELEAQNAEIASACAALEENMALLTQERDDLASEASHTQERLTELATLLPKVAALTEERDKLAGEVAEGQQRLDELALLEPKVAALTEERDRLAGEVAEAQQRLDQLAFLESKVAALTEERDRLLGDSTEIARQIRDALQVTGKQADEITSLQESKAGLADALTQSELKREELATELSEAQARLALQAQQLRQLRATEG